MYADGRPDELIRGVDIVGTPLAAFKRSWRLPTRPRFSMDIAALNRAKYRSRQFRRLSLFPRSKRKRSRIPSASRRCCRGRRRNERGLFASAAVVAALAYAAAPPAHNDVQLHAMADELARSKTLQLNNLDKPYFIQYAIGDTEQVLISASLGGITSSRAEGSGRRNSPSAWAITSSTTQTPSIAG